MKMLCVLVMLLCGCDAATRDELEVRQAKEKPVKIAEVDGVTLWKIRDRTPGGPSHLYFTTPSGHLAGRAQ